MLQNIRDMIKVELERIDRKRMFLYLILGCHVYDSISCLCSLLLAYKKQDVLKEDYKISQYNQKRLLIEYSKRLDLSNNENKKHRRKKRN